jgi:hypothetical protein
MKRVIIVAPQFPPCNLTAGHRSRYFAMHLPKFGWKPTILTVQPQYYEEHLDEELLNLVPEDLEVVRTKAFSIKRVRIIGDLGLRAFWWHYKKLCALVTREKIDLIYIPIPPNYTALLGYLIYKRFKIPYAIDYIDPWVTTWPGCEKILSKAWLTYNLGKILEPYALRYVSLITAVAPRYYEGVLQRYPWFDKTRCTAMPYGAEESEFKYLEQNRRLPYLFDPADGNLHFIYAGAMLPKAYVTLDALFAALSRLKKDNPILSQKIKIHFVGTGKNPNDTKGFVIQPIAQKHDLLDMVFEYPSRMPYLDVLNHLLHAHAVLIVGSSEPHYTPSKVFQAILSKRPILALLHSKSTAVQTLNDARTGHLVCFDEKKIAALCIDEICQVFSAVAAAQENSFDRNGFQKYTAENITGLLAKAFDRIVT